MPVFGGKGNARRLTPFLYLPCLYASARRQGNEARLFNHPNEKKSTTKMQLSLKNFIKNWVRGSEGSAAQTRDEAEGVLTQH